MDDFEGAVSNGHGDDSDYDEDWECQSENSSISLTSLPHDPEISGFAHSLPISQPFGYPCEALSPGSQQIRLFRIEEAAHPDEALRISLATHTLDSGLEFIALSYAWGTTTSQRRSLVNNRTFLLTENLTAALLRLRDCEETQSALLWVDAICINQTSAEERGHQVGHMMEIYRQAFRVLVWLGDSNEQWVVHDAGQLRAQDRFPLRGHMPRSLMCAIETANVKWWKRVWVLQEVLAAHQDPTFMFGPYSISWEELESLLKSAIRIQFTDTLWSLKISLSHFRDLQLAFKARPITIWEALTFSTGSDATDPRDKIYGLRGLLSNDIQALVLPDYTVSTETVLRRALLACAFEEQAFEALSKSFWAKAVAEPDQNTSAIEMNADGSTLDHTPLWVMKFLCSPKHTRDEMAHKWQHQEHHFKTFIKAKPSWTPSIERVLLNLKRPALKCPAVSFGEILGFTSLEVGEDASDNEKQTRFMRIVMIGALARALRAPRVSEQGQASWTPEGGSRWLPPLSTVSATENLLTGNLMRPFSPYGGWAGEEGQRYITWWQKFLNEFGSAHPPIFLASQKSRTLHANLKTRVVSSFQKDVKGVLASPRDSRPSNIAETASVLRSEQNEPPSKHSTMLHSIYQLMMFGCNSLSGKGSIEASGFIDSLTDEAFPLIPTNGHSRDFVCDQYFGQSAFYTESGLVGGGPSTMARGDLVVVLDNTSTPAIIRPRDGCYEFLSYCYLASGSSALGRSFLNNPDMDAIVPTMKIMDLYIV